MIPLITHKGQFGANRFAQGESENTGDGREKVWIADQLVARPRYFRPKRQSTVDTAGFGAYGHLT
ncbi:MAG: hypothetical protein R3E79_37525 [Caldilineaceae bacterium]